MRGLSVKSVNAILFTLSAFFSPDAFAAADSSHSASSSAVDRLRGVHSAQEPLRERLVILIDQDKQEMPNTNSAAITISFLNVIKLKDDLPPTPVLVSRSIVFNAIERNKKDDEDIDFAGTINWSMWNIYNVRETQFLLFVPKKYIELYPGSELNLLSDDIELLALPLSEHVKGDAELAPFEAAQLDRIFLKRRSIWDIIISGHGAVVSRNVLKATLSDARAAVMAGVSVHTMQDILTYFNRNLDVGVLLIESCGAGGVNSSLLQTNLSSDRAALPSLRYTVIVESVSDSPTYSDGIQPLRWKNFFQIAADRKRSLAELIRALGEGDKKLLDPFASTNLPQVWVPGGYGFQVYGANERVQALTQALIQAHEFEKRPIIIPESVEVVLVYPQKINVPVIIKGPKVQFISMLKIGPLNKYHEFKVLEFEKKSALKSFLRNGVQSNNAVISVKKLICSEAPSFNLDDVWYITRVPVGYSIQELIDNNMLPKILEIEGYGTVLDLSKKNIDDLEGLQAIPGIANVQVLFLYSNNIKVIPQGIFESLKNLNMLDLGNNGITDDVGYRIKKEVRKASPKAIIAW